MSLTHARLDYSCFRVEYILGHYIVPICHQPTKEGESLPKVFPPEHSVVTLGLILSDIELIRASLAMTPVTTNVQTCQ